MKRWWVDGKVPMSTMQVHETDEPVYLASDVDRLRTEGRERVAKLISDSILREMRKWDGVGGPELVSQMGAYIDKTAKRIVPRIISALFDEVKQ